MKVEVEKLLIEEIKKNASGTLYKVTPKTKIVKPIVSLTLIQKDLELARQSIEKAVDLTDNIKTMEVSDVIISALWQQAIMRYSKCFTQSKDGFSKLETNVYCLSKRSITIHNQIMDLRNEFIAHRGLTDFEHGLVLLEFEKIENAYRIKDLHVPMAVRIGHYFDTYKSILKHIKSIERKVEGKIHQKMKRLSVDLIRAAKSA